MARKILIADDEPSIVTALETGTPLNRDIWLKGEYRYDQLRSNAAGNDYSANVFLVGLKLQR